MCACQLVNVFGVLSRDYARGYVFIAVRSALRIFFCRSYCVICPPFELQSLISCVFTRSSFSFVYVVSIISPEVSTGAMYSRKRPDSHRFMGGRSHVSVLISNRWALDFSVLP